MTAEEIRTRISETPGALQFLRRIVRHAASKEQIPPRIVLGNETNDKALLALFNRILSGRCFIEKGKYIVKLPESMRPVSYWRPLIEAIGTEQTPNPAAIATKLASDTVKRLKLMYPDERALIDTLDNDGTVRRFVGADQAKAAQYLKIFETYTTLNRDACITLSQLGSDVFNDSKVLRSGALLAQLDKILRTAYDQPDISATELHTICGIVDNPYTSHVVIFAPFSYVTDDGGEYDHPKRLFEHGQAVVLPWETVKTIRTIKLPAPLKLVTSENAAPFHNLVRQGIPCLYTEGYPNTSVRVLLRRISEADGSIEHFGDTDLDGYRIAEQLSRVITLESLYNADKVASLPHKKLTEAQTQRLTAFINQHPDFRFIKELRHTLLFGWVEQECSGWI